MYDRHHRQNNNQGCLQGCIILAATLLSCGAFIIGILLGVLLSSQNHQPGNVANLTSTPKPEPSFVTTSITLIGQANTITILEGTQPNNAGKVNFTGQGQVFSLYINMGTKINLSISGQGNIVYISRQLADSLQIVSQAGQDNHVIVLDR